MLKVPRVRLLVVRHLEMLFPREPQVPVIWQETEKLRAPTHAPFSDKDG
jgi:hypothetical protein